MFFSNNSPISSAPESSQLNKTRVRVTEIYIINTQINLLSFTSLYYMLPETRLHYSTLGISYVYVCFQMYHKLTLVGLCIFLYFTKKKTLVNASRFLRQLLIYIYARFFSENKHHHLSSYIVLFVFVHTFLKI